MADDAACQPLLAAPDVIGGHPPGAYDILVVVCGIQRCVEVRHVGCHDNCTDDLRWALDVIGLAPSEAA